MEYWSTGAMGKRRWRKTYAFEAFSTLQYSNTPSLHGEIVTVGWALPTENN
jgi:hypothetical protein